VRTPPTITARRGDFPEEPTNEEPDADDKLEEEDELPDVTEDKEEEEEEAESMGYEYESPLQRWDDRTWRRR
jgi:hypothetical protein